MRGHVGIYLRTTQRRNKDGSVVRYVGLVHNHRVNGVTRTEVLVNLGREDRLDMEALGRLARSINRYLGEDEVDAAEAAGGNALSAVESRPFGAAW